jgi:thymidylate synthase (FAD)
MKPDCPACHTGSCYHIEESKEIMKQEESKINVLDKGYIRLVDTLGDDLSIVNAARVSYDKESTEFADRDGKLINFLIREGHTSPLRHAALTFEIYAPLMVARQWWKYAVASTHVDDQNGWNESSRRYITEREEFYIPSASSWRSKPENSKQGSGEPITASIGFYYTNKLNETIIKAESLYQEAMNDGIAPELARLFLPAYSMYVRWRWTVSLQGALTFLDQRLEHDAQVEIQEYAKAVNDLTAMAFPEVIQAWKDLK